MNQRGGQADWNSSGPAPSQMMHGMDDARSDDGARGPVDIDQPIRGGGKGGQAFSADFDNDAMRGPAAKNRTSRDLAMRDASDSGGMGGSPQQLQAATEPRPPPRSQQRQAPPVDDCWAGQGLGDALAPKKAATPTTAASSTAGGASRSGASRSGAGGASTSAGSDCSKTPQEIVTWVRSLPDSHVPEKAREQLAAIIEDERLGGSEFSQYVQTVPPEICAPKHKMKLKAAWENVLKEAALRDVAIANLSNAPKQKAVAIVV